SGWERSGSLAARLPGYRQTRPQLNRHPIGRDTMNQDFYARMGLSGPETETSVPADIFVVSVHCECWTHEELEASEAGTRKIELDHVTADAHDLVLHGREYGLSEPSCTD